MFKKCELTFDQIKIRTRQERLEDDGDHSSNSFHLHSWSLELSQTSSGKNPGCAKSFTILFHYIEDTVLLITFRWAVFEAFIMNCALKLFFDSDSLPHIHSFWFLIKFALSNVRISKEKCLFPMMIENVAKINKLMKIVLKKYINKTFILQIKWCLRGWWTL